MLVVVTNNSDVAEPFTYEGVVEVLGVQVVVTPALFVRCTFIDPTIGFHAPLDDVKLDDPHSAIKSVFKNQLA